MRGPTIWTELVAFEYWGLRTVQAGKLERERQSVVLYMLLWLLTEGYIKAKTVTNRCSFIFSSRKGGIDVIAITEKCLYNHSFLKLKM